MDKPSESDRLVARLRFRHLNLLTEVQARGSLRAAAESLNLTQPALSKALAEIESAFGFALFSRTTRGLTPTAQGAVVLRGATLLLTELAHLHSEARAADRCAIKIRIGAPPFVAQTYLPDVIQRLVRQDAPLRVHLLEERVPALIGALQRGELDALITTFPLQLLESDAGAFQYVKLFEVPFAVVAARAHPLLRARRVDWIDLVREPWVMPVEGSMGRKLIEECFTHAGVPVPVPIIEATSPTTSIQLVAAGLGIGIVPDVALLRHGIVPAGTVRQIRVAPAPPASAVALIFRSGPVNPRVVLLQAALGL
ncbi:LysR family transcriptional regulator [Castellaniella defragrans]|uniref:DNA-binding transcriptional LysR family regulator n=1 Tax=Castellaniella defragrans TaxID=75697 RepID=A0A7W9TM13_CASDE|nr:LysR family transcriptional regulator [Castellaniella defragrans]KAB0624174.1 LysR family transcriptional regulator [Castellaniella defragrans]MBB6082666.1 DNA-binding transcriptional LysR family regulator [Castellaniella defragrans]